MNSERGFCKGQSLGGTPRVEQQACVVAFKALGKRMIRAERLFADAYCFEEKFFDSSISPIFRSRTAISPRRVATAGCSMPSVFSPIAIALRKSLLGFPRMTRVA